MADFPGTTLSEHEFAIVDGQVSEAVDHPHPLGLTRGALPNVYPEAGVYALGGNVPYTTIDYPGYLDFGVRTDWFDRVHVVPRFVTLGNILSPVVVDFDVYSSYLVGNRSWTNLVNNLGSGVTFTGLPTIPATLPPQGGFSFTMTVSPNGPAQIDDTLDFVFDVYTTEVPVTGSRIVVFPFRPQAPVIERLQFLTQIMEAVDGSEQRVALRRAPRQQFDHTCIVRDGSQRQRIDNLMFDWQGRVFGLPMWHEPTELTSAATVGQTSINVGTTSFADYRVGGLAIVLQDDTTYDAVEITAIGATSLTFASPLTNAYARGTKVYPLRTAIAEGRMQIRRYVADGAEIGIRFTTIDNDVNLASTAAFATLNTKVLLDDNNFVDSTLDETLERRITTIDNETGIPIQRTSWDHSKKSSGKTFFSRTFQRTWEVRQLLHALKGRQVSFYMPNRSKDITAAVAPSNGSSTLTIENTGYAKYVQSRAPRNLIRVNLTNGTQIVRTVVSASELSPTQEQLTLNTTWSADIPLNTIDRIEIIELVRVDSDEIEFTHYNSTEAEVSFPVKGVFE